MEHKNILRQLLDKYGLTPTDLANNLRCTTNRLYSLFRSKNPSIRHYAGVRKALKADKKSFWDFVIGRYDPD